MGVVDGGFAHVDYGVVVEDVVGEEVGVVHMNSRGVVGGLGGGFEMVGG
jgi:riboflavin synthase